MLRPGLPIAVLVLALAGCGQASQPIQPGEWEISRSEGAQNGPGKLRSSLTRCFRNLSREADPSRKIVVEMIGSDRCDAGKVRVSGGRISGALQCPEFYAFSAHEEPTRGRYSADSVEMSIDMPVFGHVLRQTMTARRVGDC